MLTVLFKERRWDSVVRLFPPSPQERGPVLLREGADRELALRPPLRTPSFDISHPTHSPMPISQQEGNLEARTNKSIGRLSARSQFQRRPPPADEGKYRSLDSGEDWARRTNDVEEFHYYDVLATTADRKREEDIRKPVFATWKSEREDECVREGCARASHKSRTCLWKSLLVRVC